MGKIWSNRHPLAPGNGTWPSLGLRPADASEKVVEATLCRPDGRNDSGVTLRETLAGAKMLQMSKKQSAPQAMAAGAPTAVTEWDTSHPGVVAGIASSGKQLQADPAQSLQSFDDRSFDLGLLLRSQSGQRVHWSQDRPKFLQQRPIMLTGIQSEALTRKLHA